MSTLSDLTPDEQAQIAAFIEVHRQMAGQIARIFQKIQVVLDAADGGVEALIAGLDPNAVVSASTSLAGAKPLTREDVLDTLGDLRTASAGFNAPKNRQAYIKAAGLNNTMP